MSQSIIVVYHSGYGHTHKVAEAVARGAGARLLRVDEHGALPPGGWELLAAADAIVFGAPTYMGSASWQFKKFMDDTSKIWLTLGWKDKLAAAFTNSAGMNGDKASTLYGLFTLSQQHGMLWAAILPERARCASALAIRASSYSSLGLLAPLSLPSPACGGG